MSNAAELYKRTEELEPVAQHILDAIESYPKAISNGLSIKIDLDRLKRVILEALVKEKIDVRTTKA